LLVGLLENEKAHPMWVGFFLQFTVEVSPRPPTP